jgi:hypothetical protein
MAYFEVEKYNLLVQLALQTQTCDISNMLSNLEWNQSIA